MAGEGMEEDRKLLDKYYTNDDVAYRLAMMTLLALGEDCYYIDPSCGAGAYQNGNFIDKSSLSLGSITHVSPSRLKAYNAKIL